MSEMIVMMSHNVFWQSTRSILTTELSRYFFMIKSRLTLYYLKSHLYNFPMINIYDYHLR